MSSKKLARVGPSGFPTVAPYICLLSFPLNMNISCVAMNINFRNTFLSIGIKFLFSSYEQLLIISVVSLKETLVNNDTTSKQTILSFLESKTCFELSIKCSVKCSKNLSEM